MMTVSSKVTMQECEEVREAWEASKHECRDLAAQLNRASKEVSHQLIAAPCISVCKCAALQEQMLCDCVCLSVCVSLCLSVLLCLGVDIADCLYVSRSLCQYHSAVIGTEKTTRRLQEQQLILLDHSA